MHHLMGEQIAVDTKMIPAHGTFVATAYAHPLGKIFRNLPLFPRRD
jgi:hypothetical protein